MFDTLTDRLSGTLRSLRGRGRMRPADVDEVLAEIRVALLEADVNVRVVRRFTERVRERSIGGEVTASLTPGQQVTKIVNDELVAILGGNPLNFQFAPKPPTVVLLAGAPRLGQDDGRSQAGPVVQVPGAQPAAGGCRPAASPQPWSNCGRWLTASTPRSGASQATPWPALQGGSHMPARPGATCSSWTLQVGWRSTPSS